MRWKKDIPFDAGKKVDSSLAQADLVLHQALKKLAPIAAECSDVEVSLQKLEHDLDLDSSPSWLRWVAFTATATVLAFVVLGLPGTRRFLSKGVATQTQEPHGRKMLVRKGPASKQLSLHVLQIPLHKREGRRLQQYATVSQQTSLAFGYSLHGVGGYATLLWHRSHEPLLVLYRSPTHQEGNKLLLVQKQELLMKFPLHREKSGDLQIFLLQSKRIIPKELFSRLRTRWLKARELPISALAKRMLGKDIMVSEAFYLKVGQR